MENKKEKLFFVPGNGGKDCPGRGDFVDANGCIIETCCDECDYLLCCEEGACEKCNLVKCLKESAKKVELG